MSNNVKEVTQMEIGRRIKKLRQQKHVTQRQLAKILCVSSQAISKWENGKNMPDICALPKLASLFGVTIDELLGYAGGQECI